MTTGGEGGMILTNDEEYWSRCWSFKDHGKSPNLLRPSPAADTGFQYVHDSVGTNQRMTEMQSAIGRVQLRKLETWVIRRRANAATLAERFAEIPALRVPWPSADRIYHSYYKFYAFVRPERLPENWTRDRIVAELVGMGVPCGSGICPEVYREAAFSSLATKPTQPLSVAAELGDTSLMFPVHPTMQPVHMNGIADAVTAVLRRASR